MMIHYALFIVKRKKGKQGGRKKAGGDLERLIDKLK